MDAVRIQPARTAGCGMSTYPATGSRGSNISPPWAATCFP